MDFQNAGFWRLKAPETSIWAPEGAFWPNKAIFPSFFYDFFAGFRAVNLNFPSFFAGPGPGPGGTMPGPGPGACKEGWKMFFLWFQTGFQFVNLRNAGFWRLKAPETSNWAPEGAFGPKKTIF